MSENHSVFMNLLATVILLLTSCSGALSTTRPVSSNDLLEKILARGTLVVFTGLAGNPAVQPVCR